MCQLGILSSTRSCWTHTKKLQRNLVEAFLAVRKGLEPSTPGVTGRYSNQLNYRTKLVNCNHFSELRMQRYAFFHILQIFFRNFVIFSDKNIISA